MRSGRAARPRAHRRRGLGARGARLPPVPAGRPARRFLRWTWATARCGGRRRWLCALAGERPRRGRRERDRRFDVAASYLPRRQARLPRRRHRRSIAPAIIDRAGHTLHFTGSNASHWQARRSPRAARAAARTRADEGERE